MLFNRRTVLAIAALFVFAGCSETISENPKGARGQVILIRGLANVFSTGLDDLARKLEKEGIAARVVGLSDTHRRAFAIAQSYRESRRNRPVILVGHSFGADEALQVADELKALRIPVALVVTFDPTTRGPVTSNVRRAVNMHTGEKGIWASIEAEPGFRGRLVNMNVSHGKDAVGGVNHFNIEKNAKLHKIAIREIKRAL